MSGPQTNTAAPESLAAPLASAASKLVPASKLKAVPKPAKKAGTELLATSLSTGGAEQSPAETTPFWSVLPWVLIGIALLGALAVGAWFLFRKRKKSLPAAPTVVAEPAPDPYTDFRSFVRRLPREFRRVIDEFQPVLVLGNNASEKHALVQELSGVEINAVAHADRVVFHGSGLSVYLGTSSLVLVPADGFLSGANSTSHSGWRALLKRVSRVWPPRVVVCVAPSLLDANDAAEATNYGAELRAHIDLLSDIRDEDIELTVVVTEVPNSVGKTATSALFTLLRSLAKYDQRRHWLEADISRLSDELAPGSEQRKLDAKAFLSRQFAGIGGAWPALFAHAPETPKSTLKLVGRYFDEREALFAALGAVLAELLVVDERRERQRRGRGSSAALQFVPRGSARLIGSLAAFDRPPDGSDRRWHPSMRMLHRLALASGIGVILLMLSYAYYHDRSAWDEAAAAAEAYDPQEASLVTTVRSYLEHTSANADRALPDFFDRERPRCTIVEKIRRSLKAKIDKAGSGAIEPERVLQLLALYVTGAPNDCGIAKDDPSYEDYDRLSAVVRENVDQWRSTTELTDTEILGYLVLACPIAQEFPELERTYGDATRLDEQRNQWEPVPDAADFAQALQALEGTCTVDRAALTRVHKLADILDQRVPMGAAAIDVLNAISRLDTATMRQLTHIFVRYSDRLKAIADLNAEDQNMATLVRDVRSFGPGHTRQLPRIDSLHALNEQLSSLVVTEQSSSVDDKIRVATSRETFIIKRPLVRGSLLIGALDDVEQGFSSSLSLKEQRVAAPDVAFFNESQYGKKTSWITRQFWPRGLNLESQIPWRYTQTAYTEAVRAPLEAVTASLGQVTCKPGSDGATRPAAADRLEHLAEERLRAYVLEQQRAWMRVYLSFQLTPRTEDELLELLTVLSQPTSPQLTLLREVVGQTQLNIDEASPFYPLLSSVQSPFASLEPVLEAKAFQDYQKLVLDLQDAVLAKAKDSTAGASASPPAEKTPEVALASFDSRLSGLGSVTLSGRSDPVLDVNLRAAAWVKDLGVAPSLREPLMAPFRLARSFGESNLQRELQKWWKPILVQLHAELLDRFPFRKQSSEVAEVDDIIAWLSPQEGRLTLEVNPVIEAVRKCETSPCAKLPEGAAEILGRLSSIQQTLFDEKGEPKALVFRVEPIAFAAQRLFPKTSTLVVAQIRQAYFNTVPREFTLEVPWHQAYIAKLSVELADDTRLPPEPLESPKSTWGLLHLLNLAATDEQAVMTFDLDASRPDGPRESARVSYRVCAEPRHCSGLLSKVFAWR